MTPRFAGPFDAAVAAQGPPAVFSTDAEGLLRLDVVRSRDAWAHARGALPRGFCHCLYRDRSTGWVQYLLVTSPALCEAHPRADIARYPTAEAALDALAALGRPPVWKGPWPR